MPLYKHLTCQENKNRGDFRREEWHREAGAARAGADHRAGESEERHRSREPNNREGEPGETAESQVTEGAAIGKPPEKSTFYGSISSTATINFLNSLNGAPLQLEGMLMFALSVY